MTYKRRLGQYSCGGESRQAYMALMEAGDLGEDDEHLVTAGSDMTLLSKGRHV